MARRCVPTVCRGRLGEPRRRTLTERCDSDRARTGQRRRLGSHRAREHQGDDADERPVGGQSSEVRDELGIDVLLGDLCYELFPPPIDVVRMNILRTDRIGVRFGSLSTVHPPSDGRRRTPRSRDRGPERRRCRVRRSFGTALRWLIGDSPSLIRVCFRPLITRFGTVRCASGRLRDAVPGGSRAELRT